MRPTEPDSVDTAMAVNLLLDGSKAFFGALGTIPEFEPMAVVANLGLGLISGAVAVAHCPLCSLQSGPNAAGQCTQACNRNLHLVRSCP